MAEIMEAQLKHNGMEEVVKHINNGKERTGKIKFNFVVKVPEDTLSLQGGLIIIPIVVILWVKLSFISIIYISFVLFQVTIALPVHFHPVRMSLGNDG